MMMAAVDQRDPDAMLTLGMMYYSGTGVEQSYLRSLNLFKGAAADWNPLAIFMIGLMYYNGEGIAVNRQRGVGLAKLAAEIGCAEAADFLVKMEPAR